MKTNKTASRKGFTMIEVLTVIAILAVLGGIGFGTYMAVNRQAKVTQCEVMIENVSSNLESLSLSKADVAELGSMLDSESRMPTGDGGNTSTENLYAVLAGDYDLDGEVDDDRTPAFPEIDPQYEGKGRYVNADLLIVDPWKKPMRYNHSSDPAANLNNNVVNGFDLWSAGPDGEFDTEDDIKNW
ncbi:prepilin-type N-terminal cleavage/methylation domain-containing protein [Rubritalea tangerina]|uniref:Prepilin-type N-terminal cleavage/methylation domain-containing protein n=1 Tax=Rubritalea tangerina TaxID=430798 RepID=A0ABW4Z8P5_9BACT